MAIEIQDLSRLPRDFCVLFCWQDHLARKLHRFLIRDALNAAISRVQGEMPEGVECVLRQDSDTLNRAGSVEIANTIQQKINTSTMVVGDVTPVFVDAEKDRFYPNPNVMLELGYAARSLGWNRVICLFNESTCRAEQLPFDIRHRRVTPYRCANVSEEKQAAVALEGVLAAALRAVLQEIGRGEIEPTIGDEAIRHQRDLRLLRDVMTTVHRPTLDRFIERGLAYQVHYDCVYFWYSFDAVVCSSGFRFYDRELERLTLELHRVWSDAMNHGSNAFSPGDTPGSFVLKPGYLWNETYEQTVRAMEAAYLALPTALKAFLDHVHSRFSEIDMDETDATAWKIHWPYIDESTFKAIAKEVVLPSPDAEASA